MKVKLVFRLLRFFYIGFFGGFAKNTSVESFFLTVNFVHFAYVIFQRFVL